MTKRGAGSSIDHYIQDAAEIYLAAELQKEAELNNVSVRKHRIGDLGVMGTENFIKLVNEEISKSISKFEN